MNDAAGGAMICNTGRARLNGLSINRARSVNRGAMNRDGSIDRSGPYTATVRVAMS